MRLSWLELLLPRLVEHFVEFTVIKITEVVMVLPIRIDSTRLTSAVAVSAIVVTSNRLRRADVSLSIIGTLLGRVITSLSRALRSGITGLVIVPHRNFDS